MAQSLRSGGYVTSPEAAMAEKKERYLDENLSREETESGRTRLPMPETESTGSGQRAEPPYPGSAEEDRSDRNFERPDEFGDGDRRS